MDHSWYQNYLLSPYWAAFKRRKKADVGSDACELCDNLDESPVHVHHITYKRCPYRELLSDTLLCCSHCHNAIHRNINSPYNPWNEQNKPDKEMSAELDISALD